MHGTSQEALARELTQLGLPHLVLVWGSMYGVMSAMEQAREGFRLLCLIFRATRRLEKLPGNLKTSRAKGSTLRGVQEL